VALHVQAILQAQGQEFFFQQLAGEAAGDLSRYWAMRSRTMRWSYWS
jgi:hypothetical protein